ncbi:MAG TPA: helix-turn-helix transcriptional regulator [Candidatus Limnocylindrales bacterium]
MAGSSPGGIDQRRILDLQRRADDLPTLDRDTSSAVILEGISALVAADTAVFYLTDSRLERCVAMIADDPGLQAAWQAGYDRWLGLVRAGGHPIVDHWVQTGDLGALRLSDVIGGGAFHRLPLYDEFLRHYRIERMLGTRIELSSWLWIDVMFHRSGSDFTRRDMTALDAVRPTVGRIAQRAELAPSVARGVALGLTPREAEVLAWLGHGETNAGIGGLLFIAPGTVKKHLDAIYAKLGVGGRIEAAVFLSPTTPSTLGAARQGLDRPALTTREREVLALVARGHANAVIAGHLGLTVGTVKTHLDHIYAKLEVGSRGRAVAAVSGG